MSAMLRVSGLLASVCLFGVVAGGAVFAEDAMNDILILMPPAVDAAVLGMTTVADLDPASDVAAPDPAGDVVAMMPEAVEPARAALAIPAPDEETGYEHQNDDELAENAAAASQSVSDIDASIADATGGENCDGLCTDYLTYLTEERAYYQNVADHMNEEIRRRRPVVVITPETTPEPTPVVAASPVPARDVTAGATPPQGYCAALRASGDRSDCGWRYRQSR